jgi:hypothetical protein
VLHKTSIFIFLPAFQIYVILNVHREYEGVSKSFRTGRLKRDLRMVQRSANSCSSSAILWVSLVSFAAIILCVASQRMFGIVLISLSTQSGEFCILLGIWVVPHSVWHAHFTLLPVKTIIRPYCQRRTQSQFLASYTKEPYYLCSALCQCTTWSNF